MGWDGCYAWKKPSDAATETREVLEKAGYKILAEGMANDCGRAWVAACERSADLGGGRFAVVVLIEKYGDCWMKKEMDESCGPYFAACPVKVWKALDGFPLPSDWSPMMVDGSKAWRERVKGKRAAPRVISFP